MRTDHQHARTEEQQHLAIGGRILNGNGGQCTVCASSVLDDHRNSKLRSQFIGWHSSRKINGSRWRKRNDDLHARRQRLRHCLTGGELANSTASSPRNAVLCKIIHFDRYRVGSAFLLLPWCVNANATRTSHPFASFFQPIGHRVRIRGTISCTGRHTEGNCEQAQRRIREDTAKSGNARFSVTSGRRAHRQFAGGIQRTHQGGTREVGASGEGGGRQAALSGTGIRNLLMQR